MEIEEGIEAVGCALYVKELSLLVISDVHIGYEAELISKGVMIPRNHVKKVIKLVEEAWKKTKAKRLLVCGDLKHVFGRILKEEWKDTLLFLGALKKRFKEIIILEGNHDKVLYPILEKEKIKVKKNYSAGKFYFTHGDFIPGTKEFQGAKIVVMGHEHPAISIGDGIRNEKYKCFLLGSYNRKKLIVLPSFNPLVEGSDVLKERLLSPFLRGRNLGNFRVFVVDGQDVFDFGKIRRLEKRLGD